MRWNPRLFSLALVALALARAAAARSSDAPPLIDDLRAHGPREMDPHVRANQGFCGSHTATPSARTVDDDPRVARRLPPPDHFREVGLADRFPTPDCGVTICDNPDLVAAYADASLPPVTVPLKIFVLANAAGEDPITTDNQTESQIETLNADYATVGITFEPEVHFIRHPGLRYGKVLDTDCQPEMLHNGVVDFECIYEAAGFDGGDFVCDDPTTCSSICTLDNIFDPTSIAGLICSCVCVDFSISNCQQVGGDGTCDDSCNFGMFDYDGGDCCLDGPVLAGKCRDPTADPLRRSWIGDNELRLLSNDSGTESLNVFVVKLDNLGPSVTLGYARFPWDSNSYGPYGGVVMNLGAWGSRPEFGLYGRTLPHEIGHYIGLWHTHHGVTEKFAGCDDPCFELQPDGLNDESTPLTGDLCGDTRPTPTNQECADPPGACGSDLCDCDNDAYRNTPFENFMGYGPDDCNKEWTREQIGRMYCYLDYRYGTWGTAEPGPVMVEPVVRPTTDGFIAVSWLGPIKQGHNGTMRYEVTRLPLFDEPVVVDGRSFQDTSAQLNENYRYAVRPVNDAGPSPVLSPPSRTIRPYVNFDSLVFTIELPFTAAQAASFTADLVALMPGATVDQINLDQLDGDELYTLIFDGDITRSEFNDLLFAADRVALYNLGVRQFTNSADGIPILVIPWMETPEGSGSDDDDDDNGGGPSADDDDDTGDDDDSDGIGSGAQGPDDGGDDDLFAVGSPAFVIGVAGAGIAVVILVGVTANHLLYGSSGATRGSKLGSRTTGGNVNMRSMSSINRESKSSDFGEPRPRANTASGLLDNSV